MVLASALVNVLHAYGHARVVLDTSCLEGTLAAVNGKKNTDLGEQRKNLACNIC